MPAAEIVPVWNTVVEMWPSPTARRLMMKRNPPAGAALIGVRTSKD